MDQVLSSSKKHTQKVFYLALATFLLLLVFNNPSWAVTVKELAAPITALKAEIFGGWMMVVKICAAASGIVMSVFRGSLTPFAIGAGLAIGIHLYDGYLDAGAAAALI